MNEPITPDEESVMIARLANKLNQLLTQLHNNKLFTQVDATSRDKLKTILKEAYTLSERIADQLKEFRKEEPEFELNLHESALRKVVDITKDLLDVLAEYQNELTARFNRDNRDRAWAVDVAEWFCRKIRDKFHVYVNPVDPSAIYNAKSPSVIVECARQTLPHIERLELHMDPAANKVRLEAHTDLDYTEDNVKRMRCDNKTVLQATKNENDRLVLCASYTPHPSQNILEMFQRLSVRLDLISAHIRAVILEEIA